VVIQGFKIGDGRGIDAVRLFEYKLLALSVMVPWSSEVDLFIFQHLIRLVFFFFIGFAPILCLVRLALF